MQLKCYLVCVVGQSVRFLTLYTKEKVTGRIGHHVTFTWKFSGAVDLVTWGLANNDLKNIDEKRLLVSLDERGDDVVPSGSVPQAYKGRVNGNRTVGSSSGQASFTLYNVTKDDERYYGCSLKPDNPNEGAIPDLVQLVVVGMYLSSSDL